jgi:hypothetical protein
MDFKEVLDLLERGMKLPLPGKAAHLKMSPNPIDLRRFDPILPVDYRKGAVLILVYPENQKAFFPLIKRPDYPGVHSGQIALPGGKMEPGDADIIQTALREASEEVGIDPFHVRIIQFWVFQIQDPILFRRSGKCPESFQRPYKIFTCQNRESEKYWNLKMILGWTHPILKSIRRWCGVRLQ